MNFSLSDRSKLKIESTPWVFGEDDSEKLKNIMIQLMISNRGIGLAANQIGLDKNVFVMGSENMIDFPRPFILFNPRILEFKGTSYIDKEGCLSFPNLWLDVERNSKILVEYFDEKGDHHVTEFSDLAARCFQHELDHLNGVCFIDKVSRLKLQFAMKKMRKIYDSTK